MLNLQQQKILVLDSSTNISYVLIISDLKVCFFKQFFSTPSTTLMIVLNEALESCNLSTKDLNLIATSIGPGSYTGARVSASIAQALSFGLKIPIKTYSSLECFPPPKDGKFIAALDAKSGGFYTLKGVKDGEEIAYISKPTLLSQDALIKELPNVNYVLSSEIESIKSRLPQLTQFISCEIDPFRILSLLSEKANKTKLDLLYLS